MVGKYTSFATSTLLRWVLTPKAENNTHIYQSFSWYHRKPFTNALGYVNKRKKSKQIVTKENYLA